MGTKTTVTNYKTHCKMQPSRSQYKW